MKKYLPYNKANSFISKVANQNEINKALTRAKKALERINYLPVAKIEILQKVYNDLMKEHEVNNSGFKILPHVATEINNTDENRILDYLYLDSFGKKYLYQLGQLLFYI